MPFWLNNKALKKPPSETEKFLKAMSVDEIFKVLNQYEEGIIPQGLLSVLHDHQDSSIRYHVLASLRNNPELGKKAQFYLGRLIEKLS